MCIIVLQIEVFCTYIFLQEAPSHVRGAHLSGKSSYVSFQNIILKQEQLLSENSRNTH